MLKRNWADLLFAQKCCIFALARPRTPRQTGASSVSVCPNWPNTRPGEGATAGRIIFSKCLVVFSTCRIIFPKCFLVSPKQPADCSRRLKTLKLRDLGGPISRSVRAGGQGRCNPKGRRLHRPEPGQDDKAQAFHKEPAKGKNSAFWCKNAFSTLQRGGYP